MNFLDFILYSLLGEQEFWLLHFTHMFVKNFKFHKSPNLNINEVTSTIELKRIF